MSNMTGHSASAFGAFGTVVEKARNPRRRACLLHRRADHAERAVGVEPVGSLFSLGETFRNFHLGKYAIAVTRMEYGTLQPINIIIYPTICIATFDATHQRAFYPRTLSAQPILLVCKDTKLRLLRPFLVAIQ